MIRPSLSSSVEHPCPSVGVTTVVILLIAAALAVTALVIAATHVADDVHETRRLMERCR